MKAKPHYVVLDGLRGVTALMVLVFHVYDVCSPNLVPHGYLAVDLFFVLSGFVIAYAYDDRWASGLTFGQFIRRRLIRLHPMVLVAGLLGGMAFLVQGWKMWDGTEVSLLWGVVAIVCGMLLVPTLPGAPTEVRGMGEFFPTNGPLWSLFYEYIGNVLYALLLRRLSTRWLALIATASGLCVLQASLSCGYLGVGWSAASEGWWYGFVRMLFPYTVGTLMARQFRPVKVRHAFWLCSLLILLAGFMPVFGGERMPWLNGLYDFLCASVLFPLIVWMGASQLVTDAFTLRLSQRLGDLSYPLYAIHFPFMLLLFGEMGFVGSALSPHLVLEHWQMALAIVLGSPLLAWLLLKCYDEPLRQWLQRRFP